MTKKKDSPLPVNGTLEVGRALRASGGNARRGRSCPRCSRGWVSRTRYWELDSPVGRIFVAHSKAGISIVSRARSAADFEKAFRPRYGRAIGPATDAPPANVRALVAGRIRGARRERALRPARSCRSSSARCS